ncbi:MAG: NeuD/PglB/VioB family sugar acetyltransferase [Alphaproteobacteria bacterium]|nr:NeuD/PglB/VioB family sugar acetyltransferase [Alphaproteobacteria bacterium]
MKRKLLLIGGGGHALSCIDVIEQTGLFEIVGLFDVAEKVGTSVSGYPVIDTDDHIGDYVADDVSFLVTVGQIKFAGLRKKLYDRLNELKADIATVISPLAYVSARATIGKGTIVMHHAFVNAGAVVGENCILNTKSLIEHNAVIGDNCHIATAAVVNGDARIEEESFVGSNAVVVQGALLKKRGFVKAGERYFHE